MEYRSVAVGLLLAIRLAIALVLIWFGQRLGSWLVGFKQTLQIRATPAASGSCSKALRQFAGTSRLLHANELLDFSSWHVKAQT